MDAAPTIHTALRRRKLLDVKVNVDGRFLDIYYREPSFRVTASKPPVPVPYRVYIERYVSVLGGGLTLHELIEGEHIPQSWTDETFVFPDHHTYE